MSLWFERGVADVKIAVRRVGLLLGVVWLLVGAAGWLLIVSTFNSGRGRELRRLLDIDGAFGPTSELTTAEAERAWDLIQDLFWSALPWLVLLALVAVVLAAWSVAVVALAVRPDAAAHDASDLGAAHQPLDGVVDIAGAAVRRTPAVLGSGIVVLAVFTLAFAVTSLPVVLVAVAGAGGAAIVLTVVFVVLLALVLMVWLWGRLSLASVIAATGGHRLGLRRSWSLTVGQFWFVFGRVLLTGLIAGVASTALNSFTSVLQFVGFSVFVAVSLLLQAVGFAVSVIITVCGHLVTIDQAEHR